MAKNFLVFKADKLRKMNAQRRALSQPTITEVPTLSAGEVQYISEATLDGEPATCYNCPFYNYGRSCWFMGPKIAIKKFVYPPKPTADAKQIEYWPCCSAWWKGEPNYGPEKFAEVAAGPAVLGLGWINAPEVGQDIGGANCGGKSGGDDCDHFCTNGSDKRAEPSAFCRVLQQNVENGGVCSAWRDDDWVDYERGSMLLKDLDGK